MSIYLLKNLKSIKFNLLKTLKTGSQTMTCGPQSYQAIQAVVCFPTDHHPQPQNRGLSPENHGRFPHRPSTKPPTFARLLVAILLSVFISAPALTQAQSYHWGNVTIGGGGFVSGLITSKAEEGLIYARTDVGGAYRWDEDNQEWIPLLDWVSEDQVGYLGVESIAIDPQEPNKLYILVGISYFNNGKTAILRSDDYGQTFSITNVSSKFKAHGNGMGRQNGEKLVVDPNKTNILYTGTRWNGLFKSMDSGVTWDNVTSLDVTTTPNENGISFVVLDPSSSIAGSPTQTLFVGVSRTGENLYRSDDGGQTFSAISGAPTELMPQRAVLAADGDLYITYADGAGPHGHGALPEPMEKGKIMKYDTQTESWTDVTPAGYTNAFGGIDVDPNNPERLIASTINTWLLQYDNAYGDRFFLSTDGGSTWTDIVENGFELDDNGFEWINGQAIHWAGSIVFDPFDTKSVWVTSGNGVYTTEDIEATKVIWKFNVKGLEETVPQDLISIPNGPIVSVIGDYDGFVHSDITEPGTIHKPGMGTTTGLAYAAQNPKKLLRFGSKLYYSEDMGETWTQTKAEGTNGWVALSANGSTFLSCADNANTTYRSKDKGASWTAVEGLDFSEVRPVADPVNTHKFYAYNPASGKMFISTDDGVSFSEAGTPGSRGSKIIRTVLGNEGHLWVALYGGGLTRSTDSGQSFSKIDPVSYCGAVGIGKAAPESNYPTIYIWGKVNNVLGLYRSTDEGATWTRINDDAHEFGGPGNGQFVVGDWNVFGRVYMSTAGRGIIYGETDEACMPTYIEPFMQAGNQPLASATFINVDKGETVMLSPGPTAGGTWSWTGPKGFTSNSREVTLGNIQPDQAGIYTARYTNADGCISAPQTFTVHMDEVVTGINEEVDKAFFAVFPNPSNGSMTITLPNKFAFNLTIHDIQGNMVLQKNVISPIGKMFLKTNLPSGMYFLRLNSGKAIWTTKIIIK